MNDSSVNIDQQLLKIYQATIYQVEQPFLEIVVEKQNPSLDAFLFLQKATHWAFITAWNPHSKLLSSRENEQRHQELIRMLEKLGYPYFPGKGIGMDNKWEPEVSLLILHIDKEKAIQLGRYFNQNAIVYGIRTEVSELLIIA